VIGGSQYVGNLEVANNVGLIATFIAHPFKLKKAAPDE